MICAVSGDFSLASANKLSYAVIVPYFWLSSARRLAIPPARWQGYAGAPAPVFLLVRPFAFLSARPSNFPRSMPLPRSALVSAGHVVEEIPIVGDGNAVPSYSCKNLSSQATDSHRWLVGSSNSRRSGFCSTTDRGNTSALTTR